MTGKSLARLVRAIAYRRRLMEDLPDLEARLTTYLQSEGLNQLRAGGHKVELIGGEIKLTEAETKSTEFDQLEFEFERDSENKRSDQIERQITGS
ncbi:hypothetical protein K9M06_01095 [Candidatus Bipolaricaulota bacterium]|nr:hypothetical protein [Candidatus Bipolaricaulota bacterium]